ncbi:hypothetical protein ACJJI3_07480 [Microbulbifer sp. ZKSA004]|uniref:hypothetical protein n=1 Tax=Microbulbifer sp. ZKSA004 TaxID=3243389 RepID=UPI0040391842
MNKSIYQDIHRNEFTDTDIWQAIRDDDVDSLLVIPLKLGFCHESWRFSQEICGKLIEHLNENVRASVIRGFSYTAKTYSKLEKNIVKPYLLKALKDESEWVRMYAQDAVDDINNDMGWSIGRVKANKDMRKRGNS